MPNGGPRLLVTHKESALLLERARVHVEGDRVVYHIEDDEMRREFNIPYANLAVLFLGQGTSITQDATRLLADEGVHLAFTGSGGSPIHMGWLTHYASTEHFRKFLPIYLNPDQSLAAAISVMTHRIQRLRTIGVSLTARHLDQRSPDALVRACKTLETELSRCRSIEQLLGFEGMFARECYRAFSGLALLSDKDQFKRTPGENDPSHSAAVRRINQMIDHGNYLAYGMAGAALWALGIPPNMSVFHGKTRAGGLVFDVADSFKDAFVLPAAFASPRSKGKHEQEFRAKVIDAFNNHNVLRLAIETVEAMIRAGHTGEVSSDA